MMDPSKLPKLMLFVFILFVVSVSSVCAATDSQTGVIDNTMRGDDNYPFIVALMDTYGSDPYTSHFCGGTLIEANWVVTAAHCLVFDNGSELQFVEPGDIDVAVGILDLGEIQAKDRIAIDAIYIHPDYNDDTLTNDIALLRLAYPVRDKAPIDIYSSQVPSTHETVRALGWGRTAIDNYFPFMLNEIDIPLFPRSTFIDLYGGIDPDEYTAGFSNQNLDTCDGDSGGPLLYEVEGAWQLLGITSWGNGMGCDDSSSIGGYTSLSYHLTTFIIPIIKND